MISHEEMRDIIATEAARSAEAKHSMPDSLCRIISSAPITPRELRLAGLFALAWFVMDAVWFVGTIEFALSRRRKTNSGHER